MDSLLWTAHADWSALVAMFTLFGNTKMILVFFTLRKCIGESRTIQQIPYVAFYIIFSNLNRIAGRLIDVATALLIQKMSTVRVSATSVLNQSSTRPLRKMKKLGKTNKVKFVPGNKVKIINAIREVIARDAIDLFEIDGAHYEAISNRLNVRIQKIKKIFRETQPVLKLRRV